MDSVKIDMLDMFYVDHNYEDQLEKARNTIDILTDDCSVIDLLEFWLNHRENDCFHQELNLEEQLHQNERIFLRIEMLFSSLVEY